jgi:hypothetical protein
MSEYPGDGPMKIGIAFHSTDLAMHPVELAQEAGHGDFIPSISLNTRISRPAVARPRRPAHQNSARNIFAAQTLISPWRLLAR